MRCLFSFALACAVAPMLLLLLCLGAGAPASASRHRASGFSHADAAEIRRAVVHEPDFAAIEFIYKKGQLRSAAVRKQMNVDALSSPSSDPSPSSSSDPAPSSLLPSTPSSASIVSSSSSLSDTRLVWDLFYPDYNCPYGKSRHGRVGDGGKWICGARKFLSKPGCVIYSLGSNAETSFETDLALETECEIHVFDPTQASVPMPSTHRSGNENFHTYAIGDPAQNSTWKTKSLKAVMSGLGHSWIDVLKMDIEGGEWDFLEYLFKEATSIPVGQFLIEFHFSTLPTALKAFDGLTAQGYRVFSVEPNYYADARNLMEFAFIKVCEPGRGNVPQTSWYPRPCEKEQRY